MGGNATKQFGTQRIDKVQYEQAVEQWLLAYGSLFVYQPCAVKLRPSEI